MRTLITLNMESIQQDSKVGFVGGFIITITQCVSLGSVVETIIYAIIGTSVSFVVSRLLRYLASRMKKD